MEGGKKKTQGWRCVYRRMADVKALFSPFLREADMCTIFEKVNNGSHFFLYCESLPSASCKQTNMKQTKRIWGELSIKSDTVCEGLCASLVSVYKITARPITVTHSAFVPNTQVLLDIFFLTNTSLCNKVERIAEPCSYSFANSFLTRCSQRNCITAQK